MGGTRTLRDLEFSNLAFPRLHPAGLLEALAGVRAGSSPPHASFSGGHTAVLRQPVARTPSRRPGHSDYSCFSGNPGPFPSGHQVTPLFWIKIPQLEAIHIQTWGHPGRPATTFPELPFCSRNVTPLHGPSPPGFIVQLCPREPSGPHSPLQLQPPALPSRDTPPRCCSPTADAHPINKLS